MKWGVVEGLLSEPRRMERVQKGRAGALSLFFSSLVEKKRDGGSAAGAKGRGAGGGAQPRARRNGAKKSSPPARPSPQYSASSGQSHELMAP